MKVSERFTHFACAHASQPSHPTLDPPETLLEQTQHGYNSCFCFDSRLFVITLEHTSPNSVTLNITESNPTLFLHSFFSLAFWSLDIPPPPPPTLTAVAHLGNLLLAPQKTRRQHPHIFPISHTYLQFNFHFLFNFPIHKHFKLCLYVPM